MICTLKISFTHCNSLYLIKINSRGPQVIVRAVIVAKQSLKILQNGVSILATPLIGRRLYVSFATCKLGVCIKESHILADFCLVDSKILLIRSQWQQMTTAVFGLSHYIGRIQWGRSGFWGYTVFVQV